MDEKLNRRIQLGSAATVAMSYFLPWASIISPVGSIQIKGLYIDYCWALLLGALAHIAPQFAATNREALGVPESTVKYITFAHRIVPLLLVAFIAWQGAWFALNVRKPVGASLFGTEVPAVVRAGLDYGYWLAVCGATLLVITVALSLKQLARFFSAVVGIVAISFGISFGLTRSSAKSAVLAASSPTLAVATAESAAPPISAPEFDWSPYLQTVSVKARAYPKDYEASRFRPAIVITPTFRNLGSKTITGIRGRISVLDAFGREVFGFGFRDDDKIAAGAETRHSGGYSFEDNEFDNNDPFSKMYPLVSADNAKYLVRITEVAFADGTILPASSTANK